MKKIFSLTVIIFLILIIIYPKNDYNEEYDISVMNEIRNYNDNYQKYNLIFDKEPLNLYNLKLKLLLFNSNDNYIEKIYLKHSNKLEEYFKNKEYFSFYGNDINDKINNLKIEYMDILKKNNLFTELEEFSIDSIVIKKVEVVSNIKNLQIFKYKYPNVKVEKSNN